MFKAGHTPWNKGLFGHRNYDDATLVRMRKSHRLRRERLGYVNSPEARKKLSQSKKGMVFTKEHKKKLSLAHIGMKHSLETRKKMSNSRKGAKCNFWKGGVTRLSILIRTCFLYRQWRSDVFTRDNFTCQECGDATGGNINADHKIPLSALLRKYEITNIRQAHKCVALWDINNGRTLCEPCHKKTDTYGEGAKRFSFDESLT